MYRLLRRRFEAVRVNLAPEDHTRPEDTRPVNPQAYDACLLGKRYSWNWSGNLESERSRREFLKAIEIDPNDAGAYAGLAIC